MKLGFSGAGGISPNPPREALKIHPEEDLGALSPFSVLRAPHEARKASKNAFFVFRKNRRLRRPNQIKTHHKPHPTPTKTHTLPIIPHTHHKPPKPQTLPFFMTTQKCLHDNSGTAQPGPPTIKNETTASKTLLMGRPYNCHEEFTLLYKCEFFMTIIGATHEETLGSTRCIFGPGCKFPLLS